ncbi:Putative short-chain dehydrogenase/reductase SDR, NAD(P)-binding domain superfamily [Septoria linicola]|uniref:Short-chain dehydrogenase/reductase SDR, NAD(P)-binding domain superfamily n=1 Tax=Septoria linicola TaxID=215465 RepID=A0A9Q9ADK3_9PEZI|nr:putative short-chain dehydrogenase/reductase SDR, NAD(P)-binding domain superfamily [Septoria linicola]USW47569.1 Putative short-chain dehydrogenase/reductase SDR, NAD(P)-binding domain superfamily [Septoria linicola]
MSLAGQNVLITGASMGIGAAIARRLAKQKANLILLARNEKRLQELARELQVDSGRLVYCTADVSRYEQVEDAVRKAVKEVGDIDILVNNAGLALGAPERFPDLKIEDITTMTGTNINGFMYAAYAVLNVGGMKNRKRGTILNVTSTTGLEVPPFPGEAVYHASKAAQEAFTNILRNELSETNIKVLALRPGVVATHFHQQRVGGDRKMYDEFMEGMEPLLADDVAESAAFMLNQDERVSVTALSVTPTAQRTLQVIDRTWNERNHQRGNSQQSSGRGQQGYQNSQDRRGSGNNNASNQQQSHNRSSNDNQGSSHISASDSRGGNDHSSQQESQNNSSTSNQSGGSKGSGNQNNNDKTNNNDSGSGGSSNNHGGGSSHSSSEKGGSSGQGGSSAGNDQNTNSSSRQESGLQDNSNNSKQGENKGSNDTGGASNQSSSTGNSSQGAGSQGQNTGNNQGQSPGGQTSSDSTGQSTSSGSNSSTNNSKNQGESKSSDSNNQGSSNSNNSNSNSSSNANDNTSGSNSGTQGNNGQQGSNNSMPGSYSN